ncbi:MAG: twin-arginine translocation signal domain-containing protein, partial [Terriglobales bacterium]
MSNETLVPLASPEADDKASDNGLQRRSFLKRLGVAGAALSAGPLLATLGKSEARARSRKGITDGDVAILRFLAAAEILETDLWQQYNELGGIPDSELPGGSGNGRYRRALQK